MNRIKRFIFIAIGVSLLSYAGVRLYFRLTDGFKIANITSDFTFDPRWEVRALTADEEKKLTIALNQPYSYLGKGCQSYVFASEDGNYVIKFFKYQHYRRSRFDILSFLPFTRSDRLARIEHKKKKLERFFSSWKLAFDYLPEETEVLFVHLNKTDSLKRILPITDKLGFHHELNLDQLEFMVQRRTAMLCPTLIELMQNNEVEQAKLLVNKTIELFISEYQRGFADHDPAMIQNTGVIGLKPVHVDIGQICFSDGGKESLLTRINELRVWLLKTYPDLACELEKKMDRLDLENDLALGVPFHDPFMSKRGVC